VIGGTMTKKEKILWLLGIVVMVLFLVFSPSEEKEKEKPSKIGNKQTEEKVGFEDETPEFLNTNKQNDQTVKSFLTELMGNDYQLLLLLFNPERLDKNTDQMTEDELAKYAKEIGDRIKEGKTMVQGQVIRIDRKDESNIYTVVLTFKDGTRKQFNLSVKDGVIQTPVSELIKN
jgi:predicted RNA-binding protein with RPS1 domain